MKYPVRKKKFIRLITKAFFNGNINDLSFGTFNPLAQQTLTSFIPSGIIIDRKFVLNQ